MHLDHIILLMSVLYGCLLGYKQGKIGKQKDLGIGMYLY